MRRGLAIDAANANELIASHRVLVSGAVATKATHMVSAGESVHVEAPPAKYVSRGGYKLEAALARFDIDVAGKRVLDAGASTGGFTDCLLQHGAESVVAIDVGRAQIHERLRADPRVEVREQTDIRDVEGERFGLITADLSFISVRSVARSLIETVASPAADLLILVKPQFESTREEASMSKGVITDSDIWRRVLEEVLSAMLGLGAATMGVMVSPIRGGEGNVEFLAWVRVGETTEIDLAAAIDAAITEAGR